MDLCDVVTDTFVAAKEDMINEKAEKAGQREAAK